MDKPSMTLGQKFGRGALKMAKISREANRFQIFISRIALKV